MLAAAGWALARAAPAEASRRVALELASADTIRGVVFDSLTLRPLDGATVMIEPGGTSVTTDAQGRFTVGSAEKIRRVAVFHLLLDRTGIGSLTASVAGTPNARVMLATPSAATVWGRLCPATARPAQLRGVLFGIARAADGSTRIARARVRVSWDKGPPSATTGVRELEVRTDSVGAFYACGVPDTENVYVVAYSVEFVSGVIALAGDSLPVHKQDLVLGRVVDSATARASATGIIRGLVRDERRRPVLNAAVEIDGSDATAKTDSLGRFTFPNAPTGSRMLIARAVGYTPVAQPIEVLERGSEDVTVELTRAFVLPGVRITERERLPILRAEFEERRQSGFGVFLDSAQVAKRFNVRNIFEGIPSLEVTGRDRNSFNLYTIGGLFPGGQACPANVYLDGRRSSTEELVTLVKEWIAGVEVYVRQTTAPAQYRPLANFCGVVLVWTRQAWMK